MKTITVRPAELDRDFGQIADLFTLEQDEPTTEPDLKADYEQHKQQVVRLMVAENEQGELLGFNWAVRNSAEPEWVKFYLVVKPEQRRQGAGSRLYEDLLPAARQAQVTKLRTDVRDTCPECRAFVEKRGFTEKRHHFGMELDLNTFDDRPYDKIIAKLKGEGIQFTSMEALGNTEEAQRKLYDLNITASISTPGQDGEHPWASFEDFQKNVCQSNWYKPAGQMLAIDTSSGAWAAMSAITLRQGINHAYNLFTGVDFPYRGRKLAQAVKVLALRYAREVLKTDTVLTHHNTKNLPMIAIDRKFGYKQLAGTFLMEKNLAE
jgi:GNAT superfamily N-acetyltransferase